MVVVKLKDVGASFSDPTQPTGSLLICGDKEFEVYESEMVRMGINRGALIKVKDIEQEEMPIDEGEKGGDEDKVPKENGDAEDVTDTLEAPKEEVTNEIVTDFQEAPSEVEATAKGKRKKAESPSEAPPQ